MRAAQLLRKLDPAEWGGTETAIQRLCDGLRTHGVTPVIFCPRLGAPLEEDPISRAGYEVQRFKAFVPVLGMSRERKRQLVAVGGNLMSFDLIGTLLLEPELDVIHTHTLGRIGGIGRAVARQRQLPFVVSIHGGVLDLPPRLQREFNAPNSSGWEWGKLFGLLFQSHRLFHDADAIVTCNEKEAALLQARHPKKRVVVQPHGVPVDVYEPDHREAAAQAFPMIGGRKLLVSVGRIDSIKNQGWLVEQLPDILRRHPDAMLVLAGAVTEASYGDRMMERIRELGLESRLLCTGGLPPNDPRLIGLMQAAEVVILCSVSETFGLVLLEAWAAGAPVLSSRTSGASSLIRPGHNGWLFDLEAPESFHTVLDEALAAPERREAMAARGAAMVRRDYSVDVLAGRMRNLYDELVAERRKPCAT